MIVLEGFVGNHSRSEPGSTLEVVREGVTTNSATFS
jgi:hypothetical protein